MNAKTKSLKTGNPKPTTRDRKPCALKKRAQACQFPSGNWQPKTRNRSPAPIRRLDNLLTFGNLWLYILSLIRKKGKAYAYNLDSEIERSFSFKPSKVMVYIVLYKLEAEGLISSKFEERRKYYSMTDKGKEALSGAKGYFKKLAGKL